MRFYLGLLLLGLSFAFPLSALAVPLLGLSGPATAAVMTALTVGLPEVCIVLSAMLMGKENLQLLMRKGMALLKKPFEPRPVPRWRYHLGLAMIVGSAIPSEVLAYAPTLLSETARTTALACADLAFLAGFFVAGGELWEKLRRLVTWEGTV